MDRGRSPQRSSAYPLVRARGHGVETVLMSLFRDRVSKARPLGYYTTSYSFSYTGLWLDSRSPQATGKGDGV